jgi:hypothetical protein
MACALRQKGSSFAEEMLNFIDTGGLFDHFEVNREPFWPRVMWLVAGSGVWHLAILACIVLIPPVRDALSITAIFAGAGFVDRAYSRTDIDDAEILEFPNEKFRYPDGYFAMDQQPMPTPPLAMAVPFKPQPPVILSSPSPTPAASPSPALASASPVAKPGEKQPDKTNDKSPEEAQKELEAASKTTGIELAEEGEINKRPFKDLAVYATELKNKGKLDFEKPFSVTIDSSLDKAGKLTDARVTKGLGDETLVDLGKRLVAAMNDSGILFYLKKINEDKPGTKVVFTIRQDGKEVVAIVESEVTSADSARKLSNGFSIMLDLAADSRKGHDEELLLRNTTVSPNGNKVVFKLTMAQQEVADIVKRGMAEPAPTASPAQSR